MDDFGDRNSLALRWVIIINGTLAVGLFWLPFAIAYVRNVYVEAFIKQQSLWWFPVCGATACLCGFASVISICRGAWLGIMGLVLAFPVAFFAVCLWAHFVSHPGAF